MSDSSFRDLKRIEKRLRDYYLVTLEILKTTRSLAEAESNEERAEISRGIEENLILLEILKKEITEDLLTYAIRYQPLGRDFRRAHAFLDILYDIFRIGRYCREIALVDKYVKKLSD
ncbi:MAG: PhoU domain-containing protein, partial [Thermoprotei archaeon]